ncbi:DUF1127 domain-containing protein [Roseovarius sp.]|uniref:DUF1127 domain-containing protein n=1 Tax=Roseovarius sp. TaxID=1486281 RepID=UPI003BA9B350
MSTLTHSDRMVPSHLPRRTRRVSFLTAGLARVVGTALLWHQRHRTRTQLKQLPPYLLRDVGLSPDDVRIEKNKPFWRP